MFLLSVPDFDNLFNSLYLY